MTGIRLDDNPILYERVSCAACEGTGWIEEGGPRHCPECREYGGDGYVYREVTLTLEPVRGNAQMEELTMDWAEVGE